MTVAIVTDSTSDLPLELAKNLGIEVVPLNVHFGTETFKDGVDLSSDDFFDKLIHGPILPRTSQPSVGEFVKIYEHVGGNSDGIVSIHISSKVSGTFNSAEQASKLAKTDCTIEVVDTYQGSMAVGLVAMACAIASKKGMGLSDIAALARKDCKRTQCFVLLETLEFLQKGGRIGKARAMLGSLLNIRPMVIVKDGEVHPLGRARTRSAGIRKLKETVDQFAPVDELAIMYSTSASEAEILAVELESFLPEGKKPIIGRFGPVLGTYIGPEGLGVALMRAEQA